MQGYTKSESKVLRELAGKLYEWELHQHLEPLASAFDAWRRGELLSSELSDRIHEFHQRPARDVWSMHQSLKADQIVARGLALGAISRDALPAELLEKLSQVLPKFI